MSMHAEKLKRAIDAYRAAHNTPAAPAAIDHLRAVAATMPGPTKGGSR